MADLVVLEEETRKMLRSVLLPYRDGLLLADLPCEYRMTVGSLLPWRALGHPSLLAMLLAMPEVVRVERLAAGHLLLHATADPSTRHIADMVSQQEGESSRESEKVNFRDNIDLDSNGYLDRAEVHSDIIISRHY